MSNAGFDFMLIVYSKSQIAIEYGWRLLQRISDISVFWVHASSSERFYNDYQSIATKLQLRGFEDPRENHLKIVTNWLNSDSSGRWLLIVDNADDKNFTSGYSAHLPNTTAFTMPEHLPTKRGCAILFTSRDRQAAYNLVGAREAVIDVRSMTEQEAVELFNKKTATRSWDAVQAHRLAIRLECLPLAITQATAYIMQRERMTISTYLERIHREEERLLMESQNDLRRDPNVPNSVITTWEISFQQIQVQNPSAAELLFKMCFFDRRDVPDWLLIEPKSHQAAVDEAIETLLKYSFVDVSSNDSRNLAMHRLMQLAAKSWIKSRGELHLWNYKALKLLTFSYPDQDYAKWKTCQLLEPHAEAAVEFSQSLPLSDKVNQDISYLPGTNRTAITEQELMTRKIKEARGILLRKRAVYAHGQGHYKRAVMMAELGRKDLVDALTCDHPETLHCGSVLAASYLHAGSLAAAASIGADVTERQRSVLGAEHPETLTTMTNLAVTYREFGWHDQAMEILLDVVKMHDSGLPNIERTLLMTMNDLAASYGDKGDLVKKEELDIKIFEEFARMGGPHHPETLNARSNLARTYQKQGRLDEAEEILNDVVRKMQVVLGNEHPDTISSLSVLASVYYHQTRFMEAYDTQTEVVKISRALPDKNGLTTLAHESNLAVMMHAIGHHDEALKLGEHCANMLSIYLGENHVQTVSARSLIYQLRHQSTRRLLPSGKELDSIMDRLRACLYQNEAPVPEPFEIDMDSNIENDIDLVNNVDIDSDGEAPVL